MDNCFRFLINVDQCLNMSSFDMFFYKLINARKFRLNQVKLEDCEYESSFKHAVQDIRMYLNKYPYDFKEYQIVVAMRRAWHHMTEKWEDTLLYRLMRFGYELRSENIHLDEGSSKARALNLIVLYEADPSDCMTELEDYLTGERLSDDFGLLFDEIGIRRDRELTLTELKECFARYQGMPTYDERIGSFLADYLKKWEAHSSSLEEDLVLKEGVLKSDFATFLRAQFSNYQVMEHRIPRDLLYSPRENTLALLYIVDYINRSTEPRVEDTMPPSLAARCRRNWDEVVKDKDLELRYSDMLFVYEQTLRSVKRQLETDKAPAFSGSDLLPKFPDREDMPISDPESIFEKEVAKPTRRKHTERSGAELTQILDDFLHRRLTARTAKESWDAARSTLETNLDNLEGTLKRYADGLSRQYSKRIELRKKDVLKWQEKIYFGDEDTEVEIATLESIREACLNKLRQPNMTPSLCFEDQANVESALMQANAAIAHHTACLDAVTAAHFFAVLGAIGLGVVLHYTVLQPFVFGEVGSLVVYVAYTVASAVGLSLAWALPRRRFCKAIKKAVSDLKEKMDRYLPGYDTRAKVFREYINTLDRLDNVNKYLELYRRAMEATRRVHQGCLWHRNQIGAHLDKLEAFRGLIEIGNTEGRIRTKTFDEGKCSSAMLLQDLKSRGKVRNFVQCSLYWPQGGSDVL